MKKDYWKLYFYPDWDYALTHSMLDPYSPVVYVNIETKKVIKIISFTTMRDTKEFICPFWVNHGYENGEYKMENYGSRTVLYDEHGNRAKCLDMDYYLSKAKEMDMKKARERRKLHR